MEVNAVLISPSRAVRGDPGQRKRSTWFIGALLPHETGTKVTPELRSAYLCLVTGCARESSGSPLPLHVSSTGSFQPDLNGPRLAHYCCVDWTRGHRVRISGQTIRKHQFAMSRSCNPQERTWTNRLVSDSEKNALSKHFCGRKKRDQYGKERFTKT
ncbi:uncharacterized protein EI90DRAFT_3083011 [Cantharellus anzutake]|uniref:uncharacterized protein n=1 Tax=Cantharellus anzutake TaxID=1750568 RepID=UPI001902C95B|nr:uncharacterized protein EI90DRAFT_3083011 [Cantharellus anzutake]KAF8318584.1 hypothetical protein EI90DRAFT_3083011 [Cantharellus anzutake]